MRKIGCCLGDMYAGSGHRRVLRETESGKHGYSEPFFAMDTYMTFTTYGADAEAAVLAAEDEINELKDLWSVTDVDSDVYKNCFEISRLFDYNYMTIMFTKRTVEFMKYMSAPRAAEQMKRLFLLEDDSSLINGLSFAVKKQGYEIVIARTTLEADTLWADEKYDLVILDVSLPDGSGFDFCKKIRQTSKVPVMFLTAADEETDIIMGLDIGGDDYITKPFKLAVFLSRINALLRRSENFNTAVTELHSGGIRIRLLKREVYKREELVDLTASEYKLLCLFMENPDQILSPEQILGRLWDCSESYIDNNSLTVYIRRLRTKIEDDPGQPKRIVTVRGMGYKWNTLD